MIYIHNKGEVIKSYIDHEDMYAKLTTEIRVAKSRAFAQGFFYGALIFCCLWVITLIFLK